MRLTLPRLVVSPTQRRVRSPAMRLARQNAAQCDVSIIQRTGLGLRMSFLGANDPASFEGTGPTPVIVEDIGASGVIAYTAIPWAWVHVLFESLGGTVVFDGRFRTFRG